MGGQRLWIRSCCIQTVKTKYQAKSFVSGQKGSEKPGRTTLTRRKGPRMLWDIVLCTGSVRDWLWWSWKKKGKKGDGSKGELDSCPTAPTLLRKHSWWKRLYRKKLKDHKMEAWITSGHSENSPGNLSNLKLNGIDITKESTWRLRVMPRITQSRIMQLEWSKSPHFPSQLLTHSPPLSFRISCSSCLQEFYK